jgi:hypothetical protein
MSISYQEQYQLTCPACGTECGAPLWLILDAQEQPEAVELLLREELNLIHCHACGHRGPAGTPLLFHDGVARRVIFAPAPGSAEHEWREQARELHTLLIGSIPEEQRRPYLGDVDIAQDLAGIAHLVRRAQSRRRAPTPPKPAESEGNPPLLVAVEALLAANSPAELDQVVARYPILLDASSGATLTQLAHVATEQRAFEVAESLRAARELLKRMEALTQPEPVDGTGSALAEEALQALLRAQGSSELAAAVQAHQALGLPTADRLLANQIELALDEGNERLALQLEERREALATLRTAAPRVASTHLLEEAIEALLIADGEAAITAAIDTYPILLEDAALESLWQFAATARASGDEELARYAVECRTMLQRVRDGLAS